MASSANSISMPASHLHLSLVDGGDTEDWSDRPNHTLVTFTLPRETVDGCWHGMRSMLEANTRMAMAMEAMKAGHVEEADRQMDRAFGAMATANAFAAQVYERVKKRARRKNPRTT